MHLVTLFCLKTNLRENRFFAAGGRLVRRKGTYNVKIHTEKLTMLRVDGLTS